MSVYYLTAGWCQLLHRVCPTSGVPKLEVSGDWFNGLAHTLEGLDLGKLAVILALAVLHELGHWGHDGDDCALQSTLIS